MNKKIEEESDQAVELRNLISEVQHHETSSDDFIKDDDKQKETRQIDILNLPPRKEVHGQKKKRTHLRFSKPFIRLFAVILILFIIIVGAFYFWGNDILEMINNKN